MNNTELTPDHKPVILLVEDDEEFSRLLAMHLQKKGYIVKVCSSVADSLAELTQNRVNNAPQLAVLDVNLPDGEGWDILRYIREGNDQHQATMPALIMSAKPISRQLSRKLQVSAALEKPFSIPYFLNQVASALTPSPP